MKKFKTIDFENHFMSPGVIEMVKARSEPPIYLPEVNCIQMRAAKDSCVPLHAALTSLSARIADMDRYGLDVAVVSGAPMVENLPPEQGIAAARIANDELAAEISKYPDRFRGFASLAVCDIDASIKELERAKNELGFVGWLTFSNNSGGSIDDERFFPLLKAAADLGMIVYLHPAFSDYPRLQGCGTGMAAGGMGFTIDTSITLVRLVMQGVFDKLPNLKVLAGHLAEAVPFYLSRLDNRTKPGPGMEMGKNLQKPSYYFLNNIWATTAGNYSKEAFECAKGVLGIERILFGSDYPFISLEETMGIMDQISMTNLEKERLFDKNAREFFGLDF